MFRLFFQIALTQEKLFQLSQRLERITYKAKVRTEGSLDFSPGLYDLQVNGSSRS